MVNWEFIGWRNNPLQLSYWNWFHVKARSRLAVSHAAAPVRRLVCPALHTSVLMLQLRPPSRSGRRWTRDNVRCWSWFWVRMHRWGWPAAGLMPTSSTCLYLLLMILIYSSDCHHTRNRRFVVTAHVAQRICSSNSCHTSLLVCFTFCFEFLLSCKLFSHFSLTYELHKIQRTLLWFSQLKVSRPRPIFRQIFAWRSASAVKLSVVKTTSQKWPLNLVESSPIGLSTFSLGGLPHCVTYELYSWFEVRDHDIPVTVRSWIENLCNSPWANLKKASGSWLLFQIERAKVWSPIWVENDKRKGFGRVVENCGVQTLSKNRFF